MTDRDLFYTPLSSFLIWMAQGWHLAVMGDGTPAFMDIHHGKYSVLMWREE
jgi:hypothetical protein